MFWLHFITFYSVHGKKTLGKVTKEQKATHLQPAALLEMTPPYYLRFISRILLT